jgi:hypothetical protein
MGEKGLRRKRKERNTEWIKGKGKGSVEIF